MRVVVRTRLPKANCAECGAMLSAAMGGRTPNPGDFTICYRCAGVNVFTEGFGLRKASPEELSELYENSNLAEVEEFVMQMIRSGRDKG